VKPCACGAAKKKGSPRYCPECWLATRPAAEQSAAAQARLAMVPEQLRRARVPQGEWPPGRRWCASCQSFPLLKHCSGSRCRACSADARHAGHVERTYGITEEQFQALWEAQGRRCYICRREVHSKRPAVDHDHVTGKVRGLLCPDSERGCNHAVLGNIRGRTLEEQVAFLRRIEEYLRNPPAQILLDDMGTS
jgi:hypothetical protein